MRRYFKFRVFGNVVVSIASYLIALPFLIGCSPDRGSEQRKIQEQENRVAVLTKRADDQEKELAAMRKQLDEKKNSQPLPLHKEPQTESPTARFKTKAQSFVSAWESPSNKWAGKWSLAYDIRKTESVVMPLVAVIEVNRDIEKQYGYNDRYRGVFALEEEQWVLKSLKETSYTTKGDLQSQDAKIGDRTDNLFPFADFLQKHFR